MNTDWYKTAKKTNRKLLTSKKSRDTKKKFKIPGLKRGTSRKDGTMSGDGTRRYDAATNTWKIVK